MRKKKKAFTLIELLVVVAIIALLISILLPSLQRARELSKRTVCAANVRGIGQACKIYSNEDPDDLFPLVPYKVTQETITYTKQIGQSRTVETNRSSVSISTTRNLWMLVRGTVGGAVTVKQFKCPSSDDSADDTEDLARYYDFKGYNRISYGYHVPYGAKNQTRPSENTDIRMAFIADKGPYSSAGDNVQPQNEPTDNPATQWDPLGGCRYPATDAEKKDLDRWRCFNSPNHGGRGSGEGQNVLFGDSHAEFMRIPIVGVDEDNIYTMMDPATPWRFNPSSPPPSQNPVPGEGILGGQTNSNTDTLIYP